ncbi:MAG: glycosyltransferase family 9 protein [Planctomycetota bacterium]
MKPALLIRLPSWIGDAVQAEPAVRAVVERWAADGGSARVSLAAPQPVLALFEGAFPGAIRLAQEGRGGERVADWRGHDAALLLTGSFRSAWTAWRAGIQRRVGWSRDARGWLLTESLRPALERGRTPIGVGRRGRWPRYLPRPFDATCVELVALLGVSVADARPRLAVSSEARVRARARRAKAGLAADEPYLVVNAGMRPASAKGYGAEAWGAVLDGLAREAGLPAVVVGGPGEEAPVRAACQAAGGARVVAAVDPVADLAELAALAAEAELFLTADAGPRHVASAAGAEVVCVLGPTDPRHSAGHLERTTLVREPVECGPCHLETCPLSGPGRHACMLGVAPERVVAAALERLARSSAARG